MKERKTRYTIKDFLADHAFDLVSVITSVYPVIRWILHFFANVEMTQLEMLLSFLLLMNAIIWLLVYRRRFSYIDFGGYPTKCMRKPYKILRKTIKYRRNPDDTLTLIRSVFIRAKQNGLDRVQDRFLWTGKTAAAYPRPKKGVARIQEEKHIGIWKYFSAVFDEPIREGDTKDVEYRWNKIRDCSSSSPFVSTDTEFPTKELVFDICLGKEYANREIIFEEYRSIESECPISSERDALDEEGRIKWTIERTRRFRYYRARWSWETNDVAEDD